MKVSEDEAWAAFGRRDRAFDGCFVVAVLTTRIYCRPSCAARRPLRENVRFYERAGEAITAGFRACLRCQPDSVARDEAAVQRALALMQEADEPVRLESLAEAVGYAPHHFQRLFTRAVGLSPAAYFRSLRAQRLRRALEENETVTEAIYEAGYSGPSRFYEEAGKQLGMTPSAWRDGGRGETIRWAVADSIVGPLLVAVTGRGICRLTFGEGEEALRRRFPKATLVHDPDAPLIRAALEAVAEPARRHDLPVDVSGSAFQQRVWAELRKIPPGETRSYADIAAAVGQPGAVRAVGTANGSNPVAVLVPCHRVIRSDGSLGGYAGGLDRKRQLLRAEGVELESPTLL
ncbi:bifunctional DNA-binding transcriptional regulator/O6-methylguanine-DNA methyltransferase Ada [Sphingomonas sp. KRR8]|uniref:bifunctional DNA-binding transcriptional regulator/O6-methylguanine-DNA methyltransferase Ada n=1 Tax=Sphingomonas sp. KRR8 TaxID=2942996 RepID=UPI002020B06E|nr:bifunctional DNA-binding transcriptional regulator/O6-methylguanine-DNA methyltransferase Ada [Sphingomonas sp. KRR8]URD61523.1 bifunctional DNA-binding transcriptional regulator/O6-methylguanine-DNA methyltransferase Ada [Sphingomonas sp. KRR8]